MPIPRKSSQGPAKGRLALARTPSESIADVIKARKLTGYALEGMSGVHRSVISRFLSGGRDLKLSSFDRLAMALGLELVERRGRGRSSTPPAATPEALETPEAPEANPEAADAP